MTPKLPSDGKTTGKTTGKRRESEGKATGMTEEIGRGVTTEIPYAKGEADYYKGCYLAFSGWSAGRWLL